MLGLRRQLYNPNKWPMPLQALQKDLRNVIPKTITELKCSYGHLQGTQIEIYMQWLRINCSYMFITNQLMQNHDSPHILVSKSPFFLYFMGYGESSTCESFLEGSKGSNIKIWSLLFTSIHLALDAHLAISSTSGSILEHQHVSSLCQNSSPVLRISIWWQSSVVNLSYQIPFFKT